MPPEAILFSPINRRLQISAPNMVRLRARFRGHRESYKINIEIAQMTFDLRRLYEKYVIIEDELKLKLDVLERGGQVGLTFYVLPEEPDTLYGVANGEDEPMILDGVDSLSDRIFRLEKRVRDLEYGGELI